MTDFVNLLSKVRRPRLLIRAARFGVQDYDRARDLKRVVKSSTAPSPARALNCLMTEEARLEEIRKTGDATYSVARHVEVLIALMAEVRLLPPNAKSA
ncbi:MAG: DUF6477 family protein [Paracoccaceae bacterium]